jgi:hypothetical protein
VSADCTPKAWSEPAVNQYYGVRVRCVCGREFVVRHGDGMLTPPRYYWKPRRRLHFRPYRTHEEELG